MLTFYRTNIRCSSCRMTTRSANTEIMHYAHCETKEQSVSMLLELQARVANMLAKRAKTVAIKVQAAEIALANQQIDNLREAYSAVSTLIGGESYQGIHKIHGSTGIHTVRAFEGTCTCPGHKRHGHCKHIKIVNDARDAMQKIRKEQRALSQWLLWQAERMAA